MARRNCAPSSLWNHVSVGAASRTGGPRHTAFDPKVVIPYHYRGSDLAVFQKGLEGTGIEVRLLEWYPK
jgi:hypothetical protein